MKEFTKHYDTVRTSATPSSYYLFNTREDAIILEDKQAEIYHNFVTKAIFATNTERPEIHNTLTFLSM